MVPLLIGAAGPGRRLLLAGLGKGTMNDRIRIGQLDGGRSLGPKTQALHRLPKRQAAGEQPDILCLCSRLPTQHLDVILAAAGSRPGIADSRRAAGMCWRVAGVTPAGAGIRAAICSERIDSCPSRGSR